LPAPKMTNMITSINISSGNPKPIMILKYHCAFKIVNGFLLISLKLLQFGYDLFFRAQFFY
jgi:hypothetical protein